jgi:hypothetical protein
LPSSYQKQKLFEFLLKKKLSKDDVELLIDWLGSDDLDDEAKQLIINQLKSTNEIQQIDLGIKSSLEERLRSILSSSRSKEKGHSGFEMFWLKYAALFIVIVGLSLYFYSKQMEVPQVSENRMDRRAMKISPGKDGGILTFADGKSIILDSLGNGSIADRNGSKVKIKDGTLHYEAADIPKGEINYHTMTTPRGREFKLLLPDGTKVWLNSESSLKYPSGFVGNERKVVLKGEAYFEVAKNKKMPFRVVCDNQTVEVLGTQFNVSSYADEPVTTTIKEGSVRVIQNATKETKVLKPGQKIIVSDLLSKIVLVQADVKSETAWKNGEFAFEGEDIRIIMNKIARWYNVEIVYEGKITNEKYSGVISRFADVTKVLKMLELTNTVKFKVKEDKILVL